MSAQGDEALISRNAAVVTSPVNGGLLAMHLDDSRYFRLDVVASEIWDALDEPRSLAAVVVRLVACYDADAATVERGVRKAVARMVSDDLVRFV